MQSLKPWKKFHFFSIWKPTDETDEEWENTDDGDSCNYNMTEIFSIIIKSLFLLFGFHLTKVIVSFKLWKLLTSISTNCLGNGRTPTQREKRYMVKLCWCNLLLVTVLREGNTPCTFSVSEGSNAKWRSLFIFPNQTFHKM